jgi:VWFA-related protein
MIAQIFQVKRLPFRGALWGFALAAVLLRPALASAAPQPGQQAEKIEHYVKVTLKLIQAYVADKEGNPVKDLAKGDFTVLDNGQAVTVTEFERHSAVPADENKQARDEATGPGGAAPLLRRKYILLFDARNSSPAGFGMAKKAALEFLDTQVEANDEVGVLSYTDIGGFRLHEYLTTDHARVREVVSGLAEIIGPSFIGYIKPIDDGGADAERDAVEAASAVQGSGQPPGKSGQTSSQLQAPPSGIRGVPFVVESTALGEEVTSVNAKHPDFPLGLQQIAKALNVIPGTKNILLFSDGYPRSMVLNEKGQFAQILGQTGRELADASSRVFAVNTQGARAAARPAMARGDLFLQKLSEATGGQYFGDVADYRDIAKSIQEFNQNYYVLGYYINDDWDGRHHELKVSVARPDYTVSAPAGFSNPRPFSELSDLEKEIQLYDLAFSDQPYFQEPVRFPMSVLPCSSGSSSSLFLLSRISRAELKDLATGRVEVLLIVRDSTARILEARRAVIDLSQTKTDDLFQYGLCDVTSGRYECRMVLRNLETGLGAVASGEVDVPPSADPALHVDPPLLFRPLDMGKVQYIHICPATKQTKGKPALSLRDFYPLTASELRPVIDALPAASRALAFEVRCLAKDAARAPLKLSAVIVGPQGKEIIPAMKLLGREARSGFVVCLVEAELAGLSPGAYVLKVGFLNQDSGKETWSERAFEVR